MAKSGAPATLVEDQEYSSIRSLVDWLDYSGYTMVIKPAKISPKNRQISPMLRIDGQREPHLNCDPSSSAPPGTDPVRAAARSVRGACADAPGGVPGEATGNRLRAMGVFATGEAARGAAADRGRKDGRSGATLSADLRSPGPCPARALSLGRRPFVSVLLMCPRGSGTREARCVNSSPASRGRRACPQCNAPRLFWTRWSKPGAGSTPGKGITKLKDGSHGLNGLQARKCV